MTDMTTLLVTKQIDAMRAKVFDIGSFDPNHKDNSGEVVGRMLLRTYDRETLLKSIRWLRSQNAKGNHIYIRPTGEHSLTLVDDLTAKKIDRMKTEGFQPACVTETSPNNFQAWLQHGRTLPKEVSTTAARLCAEKFEGDPGSADWRHFGRLAGFTNRKPKYQNEKGLYPYVKLIEATGNGYLSADALVMRAEQVIATEKAEEEQRRKVIASMPQRTPEPGNLKTLATFHADARYGGDLTRADLAYATYALAKNVAPSTVYNELAARDLSHKGNEARRAQYVERTMEKAVRHIQGNGPTR